MKKFIGLTSGEGNTWFEILDVNDAIITTYPSVKDGKILAWGIDGVTSDELMQHKVEITLSGYNATVSGNAVSAESEIREKLGASYSVCATSPNVVEIYSKADMMKQIKELSHGGLMVNGAWYVNSLPNMLVVEKTDNSLVMFDMQSFRDIKESDLKPYKGYHPRKMKGQPLPSYLYKFYGLRKNEETASEVLHIRVTPSEKTKVETYAANQVPKANTSDVIRNFIRGLE